MGLDEEERSAGAGELGRALELLEEHWTVLTEHVPNTTSLPLHPPTCCARVTAVPPPSGGRSERRGHPRGSEQRTAVQLRQEEGRVNVSNTRVSSLLRFEGNLRPRPNPGAGQDTWAGLS